MITRNVVPNTPSLLSSDQHEEFLHSLHLKKERIMVLNYTQLPGRGDGRTKFN